MNKDINFVIFSPFPDTTGGRETWIYGMTSNLCKKGYNVNIYTYKGVNTSSNFTFPNYFKVRLIRNYTLDSFRFLRVFSKSYLRLINLVLFDIQIFFKCLFSKQKVFIALGPITESIPFVLIKMIKKDVKYICFVRGLHALVLSKTFPKITRLIYQLEELTIKKADLVLVNGKDLKDYVNNLGYNAQFLPNGIDISKFLEDKEQTCDSNDIMKDKSVFYIVSTASVLDIKGIIPLIKALGVLKKLTKKYFKVIWVGKGSSLKYRDLIDEEQVKDNFCFIGERKNISEFLHKANVVTCLSGGGGMSNAMLEAMACGKIILAWDTPIYRQLVENGVSAFLIEQDNHRQLAETLLYIMDNESKLKEVGKNAQEIAKQFDWDHITDKFLNYVKME